VGKRSVLAAAAAAAGEDSGVAEERESRERERRGGDSQLGRFVRGVGPAAPRWRQLVMSPRHAAGSLDAALGSDYSPSLPFPSLPSWTHLTAREPGIPFDSVEQEKQAAGPRRRPCRRRRVSSTGVACGPLPPQQLCGHRPRLL
jgi:hypothetical protein